MASLQLQLKGLDDAVWKLGEALRDAFRGGQQMLRICVPAN